jgi:hypothetical protein
MATASRSLATALWRARFASGLLRRSYTTERDTTGCAVRNSLFAYEGNCLKRVLIEAPTGSLDAAHPVTATTLGLTRRSRPE